MVIRRHGLAMALGLWLVVAVGARGGSTDSRHSGTKPAGLCGRSPWRSRGGATVSVDGTHQSLAIWVSAVVEEQMCREQD